MCGKHILLTGGTGFFGRSLLRQLLNNCVEEAMPVVTVLTRSPSRFGSLYPEFCGLQWLQILEGDVLAPSSLPSNVRFTHFLHFATDSTLGPQLTPLQRYEQIVDGTRNILDLAVRCGAKRVLLTSSGAIYGEQPSWLGRMPETWIGAPDPLNVKLSYGLGKRVAEHLCALYRNTYGLHTVIARCFAFVGPDLPLDVHFAIGNFIRDALWGDSIQVNGDGSPVRSYLDQGDLAHWLWELLMRATPGQAYNVGSDQPITIAELAYMVRDLVAPDKPVCILDKVGGDRHRNLYVPDIQKIRSELGVQISIPLSESIVQTAAAARSRAFRNVL